MFPVKTAWTELVYRGIDPRIGDLWSHRENPGEVWAVFEPTEEELQLLNEGGRVRLCLLTEPIPPVSLDVLTAAESAPVAPHHYKVIKELEERGHGG